VASSVEHRRILTVTKVFIMAVVERANVPFSTFFPSWLLPDTNEAAKCYW
jgi:hypothetical protein